MKFKYIPDLTARKRKNSLLDAKTADLNGFHEIFIMEKDQPYNRHIDFSSKQTAAATKAS